MTTEPKFVPAKAAEVKIENAAANVFAYIFKAFNRAFFRLHVALAGNFRYASVSCYHNAYG